MRPFIVTAALLAAVVTAPLSSQTVIQTPTSTIEIVGLRRWTIRMIEDSLAKYSPGDTLTAHACAAVLRGKLHFADASVETYSGFRQNDPRDYVAITVVEPQDSARIHYKPAFRDSLATRAEWAAGLAVFRANNHLVQRALQQPSFYDAHLSAADSASFATLEPLHAVVVSQRSTADFDRALWTLDSDRNTSNRVLALIVVANFVDRDSAWWALTDALRDPAGPVASTAAQILGVMVQRSRRPVDWRPVADRLRYVIDGTNLFGFATVLETLSGTSVSPSLAPALLGGGGTIVRAKLRSGAPMSAEATAAFVSQLSGLPVTSGISAFEKWMDGLEATASR